MKLIIRRCFENGAGQVVEDTSTDPDGLGNFYGIYLQRGEPLDGKLPSEHLFNRDTLAEAQALVAELIEVGHDYSMGEAVADIAQLLAHSEFQPGNSRDACMFSVDWALEFEKKWAGHQWGITTAPSPSEGGEYLDTIERFFREKYAAWLAAEQAQPQTDLSRMTVKPKWSR